MPFSNYGLGRLREAIKIADIVGRHVELRRAGATLKACCPFHDERSPSFTVNERRNKFHCFGCGADGDAIDFLHRHLKVSFVEAARLLSQEYGLDLETGESGKIHDLDADLDLPPVVATFDAAESGAAPTLPALPESAWDRFAGRVPGYALHRGLDVETCRAWGLGQDRGPPSRLMFPIRLRDGTLVGYSGRLCDRDRCAVCGEFVAAAGGPPKYLHSAGLNKSLLLFGEHLVPPGRHPTGVLVEGQLDAPMTWQAGADNVVASMGALLSTTQAWRLAAMFDRVLVIEDGDAAGARLGAALVDVMGRKRVAIHHCDAGPPCPGCGSKPGKDAGSTPAEQLRGILAAHDISLVPRPRAGA